MKPEELSCVAQPQISGSVVFPGEIYVVLPANQEQIFVSRRLRFQDSVIIVLGEIVFQKLRELLIAVAAKGMAWAEVVFL